LIDALKQTRRSAGWSQRTLAARIGIDVQKVKRLESGIGAISTLLVMMSALDFDLTGIGQGKALSEQLRNRQHKLKLSLDELAARAAMSRTTIASLERGGGSVRLLAIIAPNALRRAPDRSYWGQGDKDDRDSRVTPPDFIEQIYAAFGEVDIDPCAHLLSPVIARRRIIHSEGADGLTEDWSGKLAFVNPPFSKLLVWLRRA
jgi:transcriptional regulator with XRE-family HTH domain